MTFAGKIRVKSLNSDKGRFPVHRAKRFLGQNFLIDSNISRKIVSELSILPGETVLEIGPGEGALTRLLVEKDAHVIAIEKDRELCNFLFEEFAEARSFDLLNRDFLDYDFPDSTQMIKIVGNIPYNQTSRIISRLVDLRSRIDQAVLMVQEEVADRLAAKPGTKAYGAISVRLQLTGKVTKLFQVPPSCFRPKPKVDSRVIRISFLQRELFEDEKGFVVFVKKAFGMRRKMLRHFISENYGKPVLTNVPKEILTKRVEVLPPEDIYRLFSILSRSLWKDDGAK